jgi:transcriptional regulator with XRE-family HTH domain
MKQQEDKSQIDQYVIDLVKELRTKKELTQQGLGDAIGLSRSFISDVENGYNKAKYNLRHINALADYFGMSPRLFLPEKAFPVDAVEEKVIKKKAAVRKVTKKGVSKSAPRKAAKK